MIVKTRQAQDEPRGVLVQRFDAGAFTHRRERPSAALAGLVEHYWHVSWDMQGGPPKVQETLPHPNVHIVVENDADGIYGVHTARYTRLLEGKGFAFGIKFLPAGFQPFLGSSLAAIADQKITLAAVFGDAGDVYVQQIRACTTVDAMVSAAEALLLAHAHTHTHAHAHTRPHADAHSDAYVHSDARSHVHTRELGADTARVNALVADIGADASIVTVDQLAATSGLNKRTLQRLFQRHVGVGPKWVIKRYRMHEAVARLQSDTPPALATLALELGYFDQAHFVNDFTALVGKPPGEYARLQTSRGVA